MSRKPDWSTRELRVLENLEWLAEHKPAAFDRMMNLLAEIEAEDAQAVKS